MISDKNGALLALLGAMKSVKAAQDQADGIVNLYWPVGSPIEWTLRGNKISGTVVAEAKDNHIKVQNKNTFKTYHIPFYNILGVSQSLLDQCHG